MLAEAMPRIRKEIAAAENAGGHAILESNSILQFMRPDLYLTVLDHATADFKDSARLYLDRADAILQRESGLRLEPRWTGVAARLLEGKPRFVIAPPDYMTNALAAFVRARLTAAQSVAR
jgi:hypothetical protein